MVSAQVSLEISCLLGAFKFSVVEGANGDLVVGSFS